MRSSSELRSSSSVRKHTKKAKHGKEKKKEKKEKEKEERKEKRRVPDGAQVGGKEQEMPERLIIGTATAFKKKYAYDYEKHEVDSGTVYICKKGNESCGANEVLVLRRQCSGWIAYAAHVVAPTDIQYRQGVFRCVQEDITKKGWHEWQMNWNAGAHVRGEENWYGSLWCETRLP